MHKDQGFDPERDVRVAEEGGGGGLLLGKGVEDVLECVGAVPAAWERVSVAAALGLGLGLWLVVQLDDAELRAAPGEGQGLRGVVLVLPVRGPWPCRRIVCAGPLALAKAA